MKNKIGLILQNKQGQKISTTIFNKSQAFLHTYYKPATNDIIISDDGTPYKVKRVEYSTYINVTTEVECPCCYYTLEKQIKRTKK